MEFYHGDDLDDEKKKAVDPWTKIMSCRTEISIDKRMARVFKFAGTISLITFMTLIFSQRELYRPEILSFMLSVELLILSGAIGITVQSKEENEAKIKVYEELGLAMEDNKPENLFEPAQDNSGNVNDSLESQERRYLEM